MRGLTVQERDVLLICKQGKDSGCRVLLESSPSLDAAIWALLAQGRVRVQGDHVMGTGRVDITEQGLLALDLQTRFGHFIFAEPVP